MKRHDDSHIHSKGLRLLADFANTQGLALGDEATQEQLLHQLSDLLGETKTNPIRLHGFRVQAMFSYVAAALGKCAVITEEDSGTFFAATNDKISRPDFKIVTHEGSHFFVEVKNHSKSEPLKPIAFKESYLQSITRYADLMEQPLKFAIYWARWRTWTLVDASKLKRGGNKVELTFPEAIKMNEMATLGDITIATVPPLAFRLYADATKPRRVKKSGKAPFTISSASLWSDGIEITEPEEIQLAWMLMRYGSWTDYRQHAKIENKLIEFVEFEVAPEIRHDDQQFEMVGAMSQIITRQYLDATSENGKINSLAPDQAPDEFGAIISDSYQGKALRLWRFTLKPTYPESPE